MFSLFFQKEQLVGLFLRISFLGLGFFGGNPRQTALLGSIKTRKIRTGSSPSARRRTRSSSWRSRPRRLDLLEGMPYQLGPGGRSKSPNLPQHSGRRGREVKLWREVNHQCAPSLSHGDPSPPFAEEYVLFSLVGFERNLSLLDCFSSIFSAGAFTKCTEAQPWGPPAENPQVKLANDAFGNFVVQKLLEKGALGGAGSSWLEWIRVLGWGRGRVLESEPKEKDHPTGGLL